jgi:translation initiation factor IF-2
MAKIRVYELARELNMTNKVLLDKVKDMDLVIKSHMSSLDDEMVRQIKVHVLGKDKARVDEKRVKPTVIRRRKKTVEAAPPPEAEPAEAEPADVEPVTEEASEETAAAAEESTAESVSPEPAEELTEEAETVVEAIAEVPPEEPAEMEAVEAAETVDEPEVAEAPPAEELPADVEADVEVAETPEAAPAKVAPTRKRKKVSAAKIIKLPEKPVAPTPVERKPAPPRPKTAPVGGKVAGGKNDSAAPVEKDTKKGKKKRKPVVEVDDRKVVKKRTFKKKSVVEGKALYDGGYGRGRKGRKGGRGKPAVGQKTQITVPKAIKRRVKIDDTIILSELSKRMGVKANEMIGKLMGMGVMATVNQTIDFDTAELLAGEFGYELEKAAFEETEILTSNDDNPEDLVSRPPVVTIMGHVDHGKTSLLDVIRKTSVTDDEAGGITQHIGAYSVQTDKGRISFLDTPGHEAFTSMRSRGAQVTDIVILVVAADDGVMPQTIEAINHAKAAEVPIIVAVNKIDKPDADPDRVKRELSDQGIVAEDWGGTTIFANVSAKQRTGIDELLDMVLLQSEMLELKANPAKMARGHVIEAKLDSGRGPVATVLMTEGTLRSGQSVVCGIQYGRVRAMLNDKGASMDSASPSDPVEILGLSGVPEAGDELFVLEDEKNAKQISLHRQQKQRSKELARSNRLSLEGLFEKLEEGEVKDLNLVLKADVHGSIEALKESLLKLSGDEVKINIVHSATGTVNESDVSLAAVSNAIILGFNVRPPAKIQDLASEENVDMRFYDIIYNAIKDIKDAMVGMMDSTYVEKILGRAEVRETFVIPKVGTIAGSHVSDGKVERHQNVRLLREGVIIYDGKIKSLKRFKDDAKEVLVGYECGIGIENFNDIKVGDEIQCYYLEEIKPTME